MLELVQQAREMSLEHLSLGDDRSQFALGGPFVPLFEETRRSNAADAFPERSKLLLHVPGSTCFERELLEFTKTEVTFER